MSGKGRVGVLREEGQKNQVITNNGSSCRPRAMGCWEWGQTAPTWGPVILRGRTDQRPQWAPHMTWRIERMATGRLVGRTGPLGPTPPRNPRTFCPAYYILKIMIIIIIIFIITWKQFFIFYFFIFTVYCNIYFPFLYFKIF